jgi:hypothetical protein
MSESAGKRLLAAAKEMRETVRQDMDGVEIPEDVMREAQAIVDLINADVVSAVPAIAEALAAERERCAKIVEDYAGWGGDPYYDRDAADAPQRIAAAIRKGDAG